MPNDRYNAAEAEPRWQQVWDERGIFGTRNDDKRPKYYVLEMFPYPSGRIHMGHVRNYTMGDVVARVKRAKGFAVLHPMGWDAFGMPAENAAMERKVHPKEWTYANIAAMKKQLQSMGLSLDWSREIATCDPAYYKHQQAMFLDFLRAGLVERRQSKVNWDPVDQTVLANEQVIQGKCERCGTAVERRDMTQWFFRTTDYAQRLLDDMEGLTDWPERVVTMQSNWIGRSSGARVGFTLEETGDEVEIFTTRPDTLWGVTFFVFSVEHPLVRGLAELGGTWDEVKPLVDKVRNTPLNSREEADTKEGVALGVHAINPVNGEKVPCFVAPYVLMEYGTGAIMAVPAHDERDFAFARHHGLPVRVVIEPEGGPLDGELLAEA
jgi:leucyl-tRNA synthetase